MKRLLLILALSLMIGGCEQAVNEAVPGAQALATRPGQPNEQVIYAVPAAVFASTTEAQRKEALLASASLLHGDKADDLDLGHFLRSDASLAEKHRAAQALLKTHAGPEWYFLQQMVAAPMLELMLHSEAGREDLDALAFYTRFLVQTENPSGDLVARALPLLKGQWSDDEIRGAAGVSFKAAVQWVSQTCPECSLGGGKSASKAIPAVHSENQRLAAVRASLGTLETLSQ